MVVVEDRDLWLNDEQWNRWRLGLEAKTEEKKDGQKERRVGFAVVLM